MRTRNSSSSNGARGRSTRSHVQIVLASMVAVTILICVGVWVYVKRPWEEVVFREACTATANGASYSLTPAQSHFAAKIGAISLKRELPIRAGTIAIATAIQESSLKNLDYGDQAGPDSRGLFQQRPSQGWGTQEQIMTPAYAINAFYNGLVKVRNYESMTITQAAQAVQRSALPDAYADHESQARAFAAAFRGQTEASLSCTLRGATEPGKIDQASSELVEDFGITATKGSSSLSVPVDDAQHGWAVAHWAVANAAEYGINSGTCQGRTWTRQGTWSQAGDASTISSSSVSITFNA